VLQVKNANGSANQELVPRKRVLFSTPKVISERSLNIAESVKKSKGDQTHRQDCTAESSQLSDKENLFDGFSSTPFGLDLKSHALAADQTFKLKNEASVLEKVNTKRKSDKLDRLPSDPLELARIRASNSF